MKKKRIPFIIVSVITMVIVLTVGIVCINTGNTGEKVVKTLKTDALTYMISTNKKAASSYNYVEVKQEEVKEEEKQEEPVVQNEKQTIKVDNNSIATYTGKLTGYGADCRGCSSRTAAGYDLNNGVYYNDATYGQVRILAAATNGFPFGSIIEVSNTSIGTFVGIVLDTGGSMRSAWNNGEVWMDLAFTTEGEAGSAGITTRNAQFNVKRLGW